MIELKFKDEYGNIVEGESLIVDAEMIMKSDYLKEHFWEEWNDKNNDCVCSLNESQSYCECEGKYGICYVVSAKDIS
jgi:hypothetical protein